MSSLQIRAPFHTAAFFIPLTKAAMARVCARVTLLCLGSVLCIVAPGGARASNEIAAICDAAAKTVSRESGVPISVLQAITRTETGHKRGGKIRPWPWTVNMEGAGKWFDNEDEARAYVFKHFKRGARSFDVGCFQINYKWHHKNFSSIEEMFEPIANARYAAKFLTELYQETGSWTNAAGAYHSRTPKYANKYKARFERFRSAMTNTPPNVGELQPRDTRADPAPVAIADASPVRRQKTRAPNNFPLLQSGATGGLGSLVPISRGGASLFAQSTPEG
ncbi:transglycosylase SLT domain-containing protein [Litorivita pollutaquae]|nr:transglycosylase SLT domain-containing protein [Litorivita pollutaquae]